MTSNSLNEWNSFITWWMLLMLTQQHQPPPPLLPPPPPPAPPRGIFQRVSANFVSFSCHFHVISTSWRSTAHLHTAILIWYWFKFGNWFEFDSFSTRFSRVSPGFVSFSCHFHDVGLPSSFAYGDVVQFWFNLRNLFEFNYYLTRFRRIYANFVSFSRHFRVIFMS